MLILLLSDIFVYSFEVVYSFEEGSNVQNHCSRHPIEKSPLSKISDPP